MHRHHALIGFVTAASLLPACKPRVYNQQDAATRSAGAQGTSTETCDIVIAGGTTAATAAAIAAASEIERHNLGRRVCLLEPTDWPGGQLTASGVSAVDFDHHSGDDFGFKTNVTTKTVNNSKVFADWMTQLGAPANGVFTMDGNPGRCWVSVRCFKPRTMVPIIENEFAKHASTLSIFRQTVVKSVRKNGNRIVAIEGIQRTPINAEERSGIYNRRLSTVIDDWYSRANSKDYTKTVITFEGAGDNPVFIDATEWGEVMVLSGAEYEQGIKSKDTCGQAIVYPLALEMKNDEVALPGWFSDIEKVLPKRSKDVYSHQGGGGTWEKNWRYRRMSFGGTGTAWQTPPAPGDVTQINVGDGNDYPFEYLFPSKQETANSVKDWKGGVKKEVLAHAEIHSLGYIEFMRREIPGDESSKNGKKVTASTAYGTANGLSKVPYMRDTRRSVAVGNFQITYDDLFPTAKRFEDSVGIGLYVADQHPIVGCNLPNAPAAIPEPRKITPNAAGQKMRSGAHPEPFYLPLRAHTNKSIANMLVAGKTMAQDFLTNAATRLHPIEFASGTAAGVAAVYMNEKKKSNAQILESGATSEIQSRISPNHGPIEWAEKN